MKLPDLFDGQWPRTVLFDLDGTLVDSAPDLAAAVDATLIRLGREPVGADRVRQWVGNGAAQLVRRALAGRHDVEPGEDEEDVLFDEAMTLFFSVYEEFNGRQATVFEGVEPFLQALRERGCRLGVLTNKPARFTGPLLEQMGLEHWFDVAVSGDTLAVRKPDPEALWHAVRALGAEPDGILMVGDSGTDIETAHNASVPVVAVRYGYNYGPAIDTLGADVVVDSLTELL